MDSNKRFSKKVQGGVMIEDDGGFLNFMPSLGGDPFLGLLGMGEEKPTPVKPTGIKIIPINQVTTLPDNVVSLMDWKKKNRK